MFPIIIVAVVVLIGLLMFTACPCQPVKIGSYSANRAQQFLDKNVDLISEVINKKVPTIMKHEDIQHTLPFQATKFLPTHKEHIGQLKLFLSEVQYLNNIPAGSIIVYAGSAPGHKVANLIAMFPTIRWILIDPHEHHIMYPNGKTQYSPEHIDDVLHYTETASKSNIRRAMDCAPGTPVKMTSSADFAKYFNSRPEHLHIFEMLMSVDLAEMFKDLGAYFISDIRTAMGEIVSDWDLIWNSAFQLKWLRIMRPKRAMLKFRAPFWNPGETERFENFSDFRDDFVVGGHNFIHEYNDPARKFSYLRGDVFLQAFAPEASAECRLVTSDYDTMTVYGEEFSEKMFYWNRIYREYGFHQECETLVDYELGLDGCGDCAMMVNILRDYFRGQPDVDNKVIALIKDLLKNIGRKLHARSTTHGSFLRPYESITQLKNLQEGMYIYSTLASKPKPAATKTTPVGLLKSGLTISTYWSSLFWYPKDISLQFDRSKAITKMKTLPKPLPDCWKAIAPAAEMYTFYTAIGYTSYYNLSKSKLAAITGASRPVELCESLVHSAMRNAGFPCVARTMYPGKESALISQFRDTDFVLVTMNSTPVVHYQILRMLGARGIRVIILRDYDDLELLPLNFTRYEITAKYRTITGGNAAKKFKHTEMLTLGFDTMPDIFA